ncbi:hypothetical protein AB0K51_11310 [Kitasatospora sp. NPDC049285]|uniref:hypothetical protein n=1 Tax=Kitasatospora sp. NPDC049285 TaxID=3157096 RepID=UPI00342C5D3F
MAWVQKSVLWRAALAGLALAAALAGSGGVERELARAGAERAVECRQPAVPCNAPDR